MHRPPPRTLSHNLCFCAKKCLPTLTCSIKMNAKPLPLIIQLQLTLQESTTTCGSFERERGGPISCFLACQCSFVLITPRLFFFRGPPCRRRRRRRGDRSDRATGSIPDLSGSRGVTPASGFYRHSAQHNTHAAYYIHTLPIPPPPPSSFAAVLLLFWTCSKERRTSPEISR